MPQPVSWWREFFDDDYPFLYGAALTPERTEAEVKGVVALLDLREGQRVLDLCCGDGRHAVALQRRGLRVVGVDASAPLLKQAGRRALRVLGVDDEDGHQTLPSGPQLAQADARSLPLGASFDAAILLFSSIGYGSDGDTLAMLRAARGALGPRGQLLVECAHRDLHVARAGPKLASADAGVIEGVTVHTERRLDPVAGVEEATFRFRRKDGAEVEKRFRHRLYVPTELCAMLAAAGFEGLHVFGDYDGRPFTPDAPFLLVRARAA